MAPGIICGAKWQTERMNGARLKITPPKKRWSAFLQGTTSSCARTGERVVGAGLSRQHAGWENLKPALLEKMVWGTVHRDTLFALQLEKLSTGMGRSSGRRLKVIQAHLVCCRSRARESFGLLAGRSAAVKTFPPTVVRSASPRACTPRSCFMTGS